MFDHVYDENVFLDLRYLRQGPNTYNVSYNEYFDMNNMQFFTFCPRPPYYGTGVQ